VIAIDFLALRRVCALALPRMAEPAAIVNVASVAGVYAGLDPMVEPLLAAPDDAVALAAARAKIPDVGIAYSVAKRAVIRLSLRLAAENAARRVRVNAVSPHAAATPMHYAIKRDEPAIYRGAKMTSTWGGRWSSADEQADAVLFLLGPRSSYVSGQNLLVDGGWWAAVQTTSPGLRQME
jgi:NAD(P)-dependent dehydrogenase (short-subunit alcohol dehydrogenase family)